MNIEHFTQTDWAGNTIDMVRTDDGNGNLVVMTKETYEASTLPSNSSIPQAGE